MDVAKGATDFKLDGFNYGRVSKYHFYATLTYSISSQGLPVTGMALTDGTSPVTYLDCFNVDLFLTCYSEDVNEALHKDE